jgi:hypothetical protein
VQQGEEDEYRILMGKYLGRGKTEKTERKWEIMLRRV